MELVAPTFPPLLTGHAVDALTDPFAHAIEQAGAGKAGAGDIFWSMAINTMRIALVLEPEVSRERCFEMLFVAMVAFGDATGAIVPPEIAVTYQWPARILMNDGEIGHAGLLVSEEAQDGVPDWMVLALDIRMQPDFVDFNPGYTVHRTTMWDEGCGDLSPADLIESTSRHMLNAIHVWSEDGFKTFHEQWTGRLRKSDPMVDGIAEEGLNFAGMDEFGNALLKGARGAVELKVEPALAALRQNATG